MGDTNKKYYVYNLVDECGVIRYIGKCGEGLKRIKTHYSKSSNVTVRKYINENWTWNYLFSSYDELEVLKKESFYIKKYKNSIFNICKSGGRGGKNNNGLPISIKNIHTGEILNFKHQVAASIYLNCKSPTVNALNSGKRKIILKKWVLLHTNPDDIVYKRKTPVRKRGYDLTKSYKPMTIYDNKEKRYISFESRKECSKFTSTSNGDISSLVKGKIKSVFGGRFSLHPIKDRSVSVFDIEKNEIVKYESRAVFSRKTYSTIYQISDLINGRIKILKGRYTLPENSPKIENNEPFKIFDLNKEKILKFSSILEMSKQENIKLSAVSDLLNGNINKLKRRFVRIEDAPTKFLGESLH